MVQSTSRGSTASADLFVADTRSGKVRAVRPPGITSLTELAASPDGSKVVFQARIVDHDIVNLSLEDATVTPMVATARNEEFPVWAAREPAMVYVTDRSGSAEIWLHEKCKEDRPIVTAADFTGAPRLFGAPSLAFDLTRVIYFSAALDASSGSLASRAGLYISAVAGGSPVLLAAATASIGGGRIRKRTADAQEGADVSQRPAGDLAHTQRAKRDRADVVAPGRLDPVRR